jgi:maltokinase
VSITAAELAPLLADWMPAQRWFAAKGRDCQLIPTELATLGEAAQAVSIWLVEAQFANGPSETYQLPLVERTEPDPALEHVLVGATSTSWLYDALYDRDATHGYLVGFLDECTSGPLRFERFVEPDELPMESTSLVLNGEQSNTSLIYGDQAILKVYRRIEEGLNPDIEIHQALGALGPSGVRHIARLFGAVSADIGEHSVSLAMMQEFMTTGIDGWELSKTSVRDLMAEADLHAEEAGGDFAGESFRLGAAVAEVHADLARAFGTGALSTDELRTRADEMHERLDRALTVVTELSEVEPGLRQAFEEFAGAPAPLPTQRIHGDLHLAQVMRTVRRWVLLDFEGEPTRAIPQRRQFDSPLRDIAGMLRSYDYAAQFPVLNTPRSTQLEYRATEWAERNREAFCDGYADTAGRDPRLDAAVVRGFEADKAVYEAMYEARNRPRWLGVPLGSLARLVGTSTQHLERP